jgi:hypothetical protein
LASDSRIILASSCNETFFPKATPFLKSMFQYCKPPVEEYFLCLDFQPQDWFYDEFAGTDFREVLNDELKLPLNNWCIQHGEFLPYIQGWEDDVILFTDADLRMQRPFSAAELAQLRALEPGQVFVGYNAGPKDTLLDEARRLGIKTSVEELRAHYGSLDSPCFNWGCVAATRETWERICDYYVHHFHGVDHHLQHVAKQQWLLSWITSRCCDHVEMPTSFHAHGHYGLDWTGCDYQRGQLCKDGIPVLFRHKA